MKAVDWQQLAETLGAIEWRDGGRGEIGGDEIARRAIIEIIGDEVLLSATDYYVSQEPGSETARSVLMALHPPVAMERCMQIVRTSTDPQDAADAVNLLKMISDRRALEWIDELLGSDNDGVRVWTVGLVDQLLIMQEDITFEEAQPYLDRAMHDRSEAVRTNAAQVLEMWEHARSFDDDA